MPRPGRGSSPSVVGESPLANHHSSDRRPTKQYWRHLALVIHDGPIGASDAKVDRGVNCLVLRGECALTRA